MPPGSVALLIVSLASASAGVAQEQQSVRVAVSVPEYVEERRAARVEIENLGDTTITAWQLMIRVLYVDGVERGYGRSREGYAAFAGLSEAKGHTIPARGKIETWFPLPRAKTVPVLTMQSKLEWAIFADNTSVGDPTGIESAFKERQRERAAWSEIGNAMKAAADAQDRFEGLRIALLLLTKGDAAHAIIRNMRRNIQFVLQQSPEKADEFVVFWSRLARRHVHELAAHSRSEVPQPQ